MSWEILRDGHLNHLPGQMLEAGQPGKLGENLKVNP